MFQEIQSYSIMEKFINEKFPESVKSGNRFKSFTTPNEELSALRHGVGIRLCLNSVLIRLNGKDVLEFLHRVSNPKAMYLVRELTLTQEGWKVHYEILLFCPKAPHFLLLRREGLPTKCTFEELS